MWLSASGQSSTMRTPRPSAMPPQMAGARSARPDTSTTVAAASTPARTYHGPAGRSSRAIAVRRRAVSRWTGTQPPCSYRGRLSPSRPIRGYSTKARHASCSAVFSGALCRGGPANECDRFDEPPHCALRTIDGSSRPERRAGIHIAASAVNARMPATAKYVPVSRVVFCARFGATGPCRAPRVCRTKAVPDAADAVTRGRRRAGRLERPRRALLRESGSESIP
jgi:hypothetical protein